MADAVSKLYAEIGFKVNQDGLKQLQSILKDVSKELNSINKATKDAARSFGIFSKEQEKQTISDGKKARERIKTEREETKNKMVIRNQEFKETMAIRKADFNEKLKLDRENERLARSEERRNQRASRERKRILRDALHATGDFARGIGNYLKVGAFGFGRLLYSGVNESLGRSVATRDFMLATGANLGDIQSVVGRFASIGENVNQEQIMGDLYKLSQGIADIALGQGDADTYKLLGQAAERGDIAGMVKGIGRAGSYIDNDMFANLLGKIGLPSYWLSFFKARGGGQEVTNFIDQEGNQRILDAKSSLGTMMQSFRNLADWLTATLSPTIVEITGSLQNLFQNMSVALQGEEGQRLSDLLRELSQRLLSFLKTISPERITNILSTFVGALEYLAGKVIWLARKLGYIPESEKEQYMKDFSEKIRGRMMSGDMQDWAINREAIKIGYKPNGIVYNDNRVINSNVTTNDENIVDAVKNEAIKFGGINLDSNVVAYVGGWGSGR